MVAGVNQMMYKQGPAYEKYLRAKLKAVVKDRVWIRSELDRLARGERYGEDTPTGDAMHWESIPKTTDSTQFLHDLRELEREMGLLGLLDEAGADAGEEAGG
jgi:hypothetical protein